MSRSSECINNLIRDIEGVKSLNVLVNGFCFGFVAVETDLRKCGFTDAGRYGGHSDGCVCDVATVGEGVTGGIVRILIQLRSEACERLYVSRSGT